MVPCLSQDALYQVPSKSKLDHEGEGAIHTSEVAENCRLASPEAATSTAAAEARSPKVKMFRSQGIILVSALIPDLDKVLDHQVKG